SLYERQRGRVRDIVKAVLPKEDSRGKEGYEQKISDAVARLRLELRLAALLHDTGHSLFSHASEMVFQDIPLVQMASDDITRIVGKRKGAGEALAFAIAISDSVNSLLTRGRRRLLGDATSEEYEGEIDLINIALLIVGRSRHPFLQFL